MPVESVLNGKAGVPECTKQCTKQECTKQWQILQECACGLSYTEHFRKTQECRKKVHCLDFQLYPRKTGELDDHSFLHHNDKFCKTLNRLSSCSTNTGNLKINFKTCLGYFLNTSCHAWRSYRFFYKLVQPNILLSGFFLSLYKYRPNIHMHWICV